MINTTIKEKSKIYDDLMSINPKFCIDKIKSEKNPTNHVYQI